MKETDNVINAGYMVLNPKIFDYIDGDDTVFEKAPLERLAAEGQLKAYMHPGFWKCMDTKRDKDMLEEMIQEKAGSVDGMGEIEWQI